MMDGGNDDFEFHDESEEEYGEPDPVLEEPAFARLMEAYYGPALGHTNLPNDESATQSESVGLEDHLPALEAEARAPLYQGAKCSRYVLTPSS
jgi:hypothetical protein